MIRSKESWTAPSSRKTNAVALWAAGGILAGAALGWLLPWETWRSGGGVVLGDFALLCLLGALAWRLLLPESGGGGLGRWASVAVVTALTLAVREWAWRLLPQALGVLHGVAVCLAVVLFLTPPAIDLLTVRADDGRTDPDWSAETLIRLGLGLLIAAWTLLASV